MNSEQIKHNAHDLELELGWLDQVLKGRSALNRQDGQSGISKLEDIEPPLLSPLSTYGKFVERHALDFDERLVLMLALAPHVQPKALDIFLNSDGPSSGFGGWEGKSHKGFLPTGETVLFVLAGRDLEKRIKLSHIFSRDHLFATKQVVWLDDRKAGEPQLSGALRISQDFLDLFTMGKVQRPVFGAEFPAKLISTEMEWDDLILHRDTAHRLQEIVSWISVKERLADDPHLRKRIRPGYKALFYGPPGTGKSLSAAVIGKITGRDVFRIDISKMVSKYIGETEKNLSKIFDRADDKDWILFFDEADALFGKRTETKESNDRFANQEVSYLLQRIEDYNGLAILASNLKENIDPAFVRRLKAIIPFPMPSNEERERIWRSFFSGQITLDPEVNIRDIARRYQMAGGSIINVVEYCTLQALQKHTELVSERDIMAGIKLEFSKVGRML